MKHGMNHGSLRSLLRVIHDERFRHSLVMRVVCQVHVIDVCIVRVLVDLRTKGRVDPIRGAELGACLARL